MAIIQAKGLSSSLASSKAKAKMVITCAGIANSSSSSSAYLIHPVTISSVEAYSDSKVRITFDRPMKKDAALLDVDNYLLTSSVASVDVYYDTITPEAIDSPRFVDVELTNEMTNGETYNIEIETDNGPISKDHSPLTDETNTTTFNGLGTIPDILSVKAVSKNRVDVIFTEAMADNETIRDASKYSFDNGLDVLSVLGLDSDTVQLVTSDQESETLYTLTITPE